MKAAWDITVNKFAHVTAIGCASHGLNLLLNNFVALETVEEMYRKIRPAVFKKKHEGESGKNKIVNTHTL